MPTSSSYRSYGDPPSSSSSSNNAQFERIKRIIISIAVLLVLLIIFVVMLNGCDNLPPGEVGVVVNKMGSDRGVSGVTLKTGTILYNPITTKVIPYPSYVQTVKWTKSSNEGNAADESITFTSSKGTVVNADISLSYQLDPKKIPDFYVKYRAQEIGQFTDGYLHNVVRDEFNDVAGHYTVEEIMSNNGPILKQVIAQVQSIVQKDGVIVSQLGFLNAPRPPESITVAMNNKVTADQIALQKQSEVAQSEAEARKLEADATGRAQANIIGAKGEAEANRLRSESLTPQLIELEKIRRWDGHNPQVVNGAGGGSTLVQVK